MAISSQVDNLVHQIELGVLELLLHILAHNVRRLAQHIDIQHSNNFPSQIGLKAENTLCRIIAQIHPFCNMVFPFPPFDAGKSLLKFNSAAALRPKN